MSIVGTVKSTRDSQFYWLDVAGKILIPIDLIEP